MAQRQRLDLDDHLPYLVNRVGTAVAAIFTGNALGPEGMTIEMWRILAALAHDGDVRQVDLSARTSIDPSTISRIVGRLVERGLVMRTRSPVSSREVVVALSPKGSALVARLTPMALKLEAAATQGLAARDVRALKRLLRDVFENLRGVIRR